VAKLSVPVLEGFELIVPCGLHGVVMTSVQVERGDDEDPSALDELVRARVTSTFARTFARLPRSITAEALESRIP
jgi:lipoate-protein ligase B